ncbi:MAG: efflux RND transporter periplasmic adaptor subunit [Proteobacteria bacterium]|nr:efflux RND transporter periplasmic adaptor subunit [Pseudomonadota bacterium]
MTRKKWIIVTCASVIVLIGIGLVLGRLSKDDNSQSLEESSAIRPVKYMRLEETHHAIKRTFPGIVQPAGEMKLAFRVGGPLVEMNVVTGEKVKKGDIIAKIDPRDYKNRVNRLDAGLEETQAALNAMQRGARPEDVALLEADLSAAQAQFAEIQQNYERYRVLYSEKAAAKATFDSAKTAFDMAEARVRAAEQSLEKGRRGARKEDVDAMKAKIKGLLTDMKAARDALNDTCLKVPLDGVIDKIFIENYETAAPGMPVVTLLDFSHIEVGTTVDEELVIEKDRIIGLECSFEAYPERLYPASLKEIGSQPMLNHQSYPLTVNLELPRELNIQSGMSATVIITIADKDAAPLLSVPAAAVFIDSEGSSCVWLINPQTLKVEKQKVKTGRIDNDRVYITEGIASGQQIVTAGARFLRENQSVRLLENRD